MRHLILAASLSLASAARCASVTTPTIAAQIQVTLAPEKKVMMLGEPNFLRFTVRNLSPQNWKVEVGGDYRNALGRPDSFTVKVADAEGKPVPQPDSKFNMGGLFGPQKIPSGSSYAFDLFVPDWATFMRTGKYQFKASRTLNLSEDVPGPDHQDDWHTKAVAIPAEAACELQAVPRDEKKMGEVIAALGQSMLNPDKAYGAAVTLAYIQDERVIPYFLRALGTRSYEQKVIALGALSKFKSDAAFEGLKLGIATRGEDMENTATPEVAASWADNIRNAAAVALSESPNPKARTFLIEQRHDSSFAVRLTVVHALGEMPPAQSLPILREMARDQDKTVADEARRYVKLLSAKN